MLVVILVLETDFLLFRLIAFVLLFKKLIAIVELKPYQVYKKMTEMNYNVGVNNIICFAVSPIMILSWRIYIQL